MIEKDTINGIGSILTIYICMLLLVCADITLKGLIIAGGLTILILAIIFILFCIKEGKDNNKLTPRE